jgi:FkbM family methyltransferase
MIPLRDALEINVPVIEPRVFAPTIAHMLEQHVKPGQVHDADFWFFRDIPQTAVFCDVGANLGLSVLSLAATGASPTVDSFEINPALYDGLRATVATYPNTWRLHEYGLSDVESEAWIYIAKVDDLYILGEATLRLDFLQDPDSISRLLTYGARGELSVGKMKARVRRFDELNLTPDYLKIDAEGAEALVIAGMRDTLRRARPVLMIENGAMQSVDAEMIPLGFRSFTYDPASHRLRDRTADAGQNTFYVHQTRIEELIQRGQIVK